MRRFAIVIVFILSTILFWSLHVPQQGVSLQHQMPSSLKTGESTEFSLTLHKGSLKGPARFIIEVPSSGMEFSLLESGGSELLNEGDKHSFIWTELPESADIQLKIGIKAHRFFTGIFIARFSFSYIDGTTVEKSLGVHDIRMVSSGKNTEVANNQNSNQNNTSTNNTTGNTNETNTTTENSTGNNETTNNNNNSTINTNNNTNQNTVQTEKVIDPITKKPGTPILEASGIKGLFFRVQVAASHFRVTQEYFKDRYKFDEQLYVDLVDGWTKYTIGDFSNFEDANAKRKTLSVYPFKGPFIVAFNDGQRIPIYQANMLSKVLLQGK
ncbi:MAG: hypothetical protein K1X56_12935 [Flavobacteriales bacterium]|nr:hypothetical protein [Flavobacteriales bacterium]